MAESIDTSLLKVPFESLKRRSRERKHVVDGLEALAKALAQAAEAPGPAVEQQLAGMVQQVQALLREVEEIGGEEARDAQRCRARLQHLATLGPMPRDGVLEWNRQRLPRVVADHLLRAGHSRTAAMLAQAAQLEDLVDSHVFAAAVPITEALARRDCGPALAWCEAHRGRLRKARSKLEFRLRLQEFIELVRAEQRLAAIAYSQQHLAPWAEAHFPELQRALAALVFGPRTACGAYAALFAPERWADLAALFRQELFRLNAMAQQSLLTLQLQAGLCALKSPQGAGGHESKEDPLHHQGFAALAGGLPYAKHVHSRLVCGITREPMDEHNPPLVLPNGTVYSEKAVQQGSGAGGSFTDPVSGETFQRQQMRRAYIS